MLRDYEDENGNVVLYFDDVPPDAKTKKYKIELDPNMRNDYASDKWIEAEDQQTYTRNIAVREHFNTYRRPKIWKMMEDGCISKQLWKEVSDGKQNLHHYFPITLGGKNTSDNIYLIEKEAHVRLHQVFLSSVNYHLRKPQYLKLHDEGRLYLELPVPDSHLLDAQNLLFSYQQADKSVLSRYSQLSASETPTVKIGSRTIHTSPIEMQGYCKRLIKGRKIKHILTERAFEAIKKSDFDQLKKIIDNAISYGLTVDMLHNNSGQTLLMYACECGDDRSQKQTDIIVYLLEKGAHPNQKDNLGKTALHYIEKVRPYIVMCLIESGGDVNSEDKFGRTPVFFLGNYLAWPKMAVLEKHYAKINHKAKNGNTALFRAFKHQWSNMIYALIKHGINVIEENDAGVTAFEYVKKKLEGKKFKGRRYLLNQNKLLVRNAQKIMENIQLSQINGAQRD